MPVRLVGLPALVPVQTTSPTLTPMLAAPDSLSAGVAAGSAMGDVSAAPQDHEAACALLFTKPEALTDAMCAIACGEWRKVIAIASPFPRADLEPLRVPLSVAEPYMRAVMSADKDGSMTAALPRAWPEVMTPSLLRTIACFAVCRGWPRAVDAVLDYYLRRCHDQDDDDYEALAHETLRLALQRATEAGDAPDARAPWDRTLDVLQTRLAAWWPLLPCAKGVSPSPPSLSPPLSPMTPPSSCILASSCSSGSGGSCGGSNASAAIVAWRHGTVTTSAR